METGETLIDQMDRFSVLRRSIILQEAHELMNTFYSIWQQQHFSMWQEFNVWRVETMTIKMSLKEDTKIKPVKVWLYILATLKQYCLKYWTTSVGFYQSTACTAHTAEKQSWPPGGSFFFFINISNVVDYMLHNSPSGILVVGEMCVITLSTGISVVIDWLVCRNGSLFKCCK